MNVRRQHNSSVDPVWVPRLQLPTPDTIVFDMDGVLADVRGSYRVCVIRTADVFGCRLTNQMISKAKARGNANNDWEFTRDLMAAEGILVELEKVTDVFQNFYLGHDNDPGLRLKEQLLIKPDFLSELADRYQLAIVTGRPRDEATWFLRRFQIDHFFKCLIGLDDARAKPDPDGIQKAIQELGAAVAWMIGDTPDDLIAARSANAVPLGIAPPGEEAMRLSLLNAGACIVLTDVNELESILLERFPS
ncbi:MAG: HAD hydrolase-like protein [Rhodothermia bacterium]|nr:MAG: HAD hydrolase-like protein [Rhodothermia bacterium]